MRFAQGKLRAGSVSMGRQILRFAQDDKVALRMTGLDRAVGEELSRAFEPCLKTQSVDHAVWASGE